MNDSLNIQYMAQPDVRRFQERKLAETLDYVNRYSPFYRERFAADRIDVAAIRRLEDLQQLPVTVKHDLQTRNHDFLCVEASQIRDYVTTSGTLGEPVTFADTENDLRRLALSEALSYEMAGCQPSDVIQQMVTIDRCFMAGQACMLGSLRFGAGIVRAGNGIPELQWNMIRRLNPAVIICVPSFLLKLIDYAEKNGIDCRQSSVKRAICVGESVRRDDHSYNLLGEKIHARWPELLMRVNYASTEMQSSFNECECECGAHHKPDLTIVEFLDDDNRPVSDGAGEITITTLGVEGMPLVRFKTGDVCHHYAEQCACGRTSVRIGPIIGRKGQMIKYMGTTLYPAALYDILDNIPKIVNYIVEVYTNTIGTDGIRIIAGSADNSEQFVKQIKDVFRAKIRVAPEVIFEPVELIAAKQQPPTSRKLIKFFDYR